MGRRQAAEAVSKRMLQSRAVEVGLRELLTTASADVGNGKATPQNLEIYRFDTASATSGRSTGPSRFATIVGIDDANTF
jgi:hypothetical protein